MASAIQKITLSVSRDIPFNKLVLSQANVRRVKAGVAIEELAADIARRTMLQSLTVRPVLDAGGVETGMYEVPAGGRRFRALELLVRQKLLAKTAPIPCIVRTEGIAEEDSLAENVQRAPLHPLDQFRAFLTLREKGQSEEEIAATFFVSVAVVKQRLRLASISPRLLDVYAEDGMTLDQLMAFTVSADHERQEQVWERLQSAYSREPFAIRRLLTEGAVRASDKRARFIGEAYEASGGAIMRDLFQGDDGGWLQDVALVERLVAERLDREADVVRAESWRWIEVALDFPYGHTFGLRQIRGEQVPLTAEEETAREALRAEYDQLEDEYAELEEIPEPIEQRFAEIEQTLGGMELRPLVFDLAEVARAGAFVSIDSEGELRVERGYVRPEDELPIPAEPMADAAEDAVADGDDATVSSARVENCGDAVHGEPEQPAEPDEDEGMKPIPDRLISELTAHRTLALRVALGKHRDVAFLAALHALCLRLFYPYGQDTCLELDVKSVSFHVQAPGLNDTTLARTLAQRHQDWQARLPKQPEELWDVLASFGELSREALFAHCVSLSVNALFEPYSRRPRAIAHAGTLAQAVDLDMAASWTPTVDNYLGRVTKARILAAVREAKGEHAAQLIGHLKRGEMAEKAEALLAGTGWLPEALRTPGRAASEIASAELADATEDAAPIAEHADKPEPSSEHDDEAEPSHAEDA